MSGIPLSLQSRSRLPGLAFPSIPGMEVLPLHAVLLQLEQSQWLPPQHLQALQERQMEALLDHVRETVPWYHGRLQGRRARFRRTFRLGGLASPAAAYPA